MDGCMVKDSEGHPVCAKYESRKYTIIEWAHPKSIYYEAWKTYAGLGMKVVVPTDTLMVTR